MTGYDVIGDVHGHVERLEALLRQMGYSERDGAWRHPERTAVFVGDLIDRAAGTQMDTLRLVRSMCDAGSAQMVIGNHEFNAVAYATHDLDKGDWCRLHTEENRHQHSAFIDELGFDSADHRWALDWFCSLPLWLDLGGLRVVHACWSQSDMDYLGGVLDDQRALTVESVIDGSIDGHQTYLSIENLLKGPEVHMQGYSYDDKGGIRRELARVAWWDGDATTLRHGAVVPSDTLLRDPSEEPAEHLPETPLPDSVPRYHGDVPVVFGHYWYSGELRLDNPKAVCVDYSAGKGGPLVAYRWSGETELTTANLEAC
jgi:hypothetical protein